ncbi:hypothetical protein [Streptosporangium sp. KLBMP 9127]|nr:hypothetical protein [Streptosporangium sp. KLBMP 9127]
MAGFEVNYRALEECGSVAAAQTGVFGGIGDGFTPGACDASIFGRLDASEAVAKATGGVETAAAGQFAPAESLLGGIARAVEAVSASLRGAEDAATPTRATSA